MSIATLLVAPDDRAFNQETFSFEHAIAHRNLFGIMADQGLGRFSVLPYKLDPHYLTQGGWKTDHGQAHHDFHLSLLGWYTFWFLNIPLTENVTISTGQNFIDPNLADQEQLNWWTFANHIEHLIAESVVPLNYELTFPFW